MMGGWRRYGQIWLAFLRTSMVADMEYRANITVKIFTDFLWYLAQFVTFEVLYHQTNSLAGWHAPQLRVFLTLLFVVDGTYMILFSENLDQMPSKVVKGELDLLLAKPVDSQFMLSFMKMNTAYLINLILVSTGFAWALTQLDGGVPWTKLPLLLIAIPSGLAVMYSTKLIFAAASIFFGNTSNIMMLWFQIYRLGTRPDVMYPPWLRYLVLAVIPMGFIASVPARILVGPAEWWLPLGSAVVGIVAIVFSRWYWRFAISRYASASS